MGQGGQLWPIDRDRDRWTTMVYYSTANRWRIHYDLTYHTMSSIVKSFPWFLLTESYNLSILNEYSIWLLQYIKRKLDFPGQVLNDDFVALQQNSLSLSWSQVLGFKWLYHIVTRKLLAEIFFAEHWPLFYLKSFLNKKYGNI